MTFEVRWVNRRRGRSMVTRETRMTSPHSDPPAHTGIVDVTSERLVDLVHSRDPKLVASVRELTALLDRSPDTRQGWNSAITFE
jgi:hypothetical protein